MADAAEPADVVEVELPDLSTRKEWFEDWEESTSEAQKLARRDRAYYDNDQWTQDQVEELKRRAQPVLTKNRIARKINFILGEEIKKRVDPVARPRTPQHVDSARAATDALRYVEEDQKFDTVRSLVLKNCLIEGFGGALKEVEQDDDGTYKHVLRHVEWDRLFYDPHSRAPDFNDALYRGVVAWMELEDAIALYPDAEEALRQAISRDIGGTAGDTTEDAPRRWVDSKRKRVKIVEMYFRQGKDWYKACFTEAADLVEPSKTYIMDEKGRHSVCPLVMMSCYVDAEGMRYGVVRQLISPQDEINKRSSKALHLLNVSGVIAEDGVVLDPEQFMAELAKPDGFATGVAPNALKDGSVQIREGSQLAQGQLQLLQEAKADIDTIGPSSSTLPDIPESASGRAFLARQSAASQELGTIFDQLRAWTLAVFTLDWYCIRQYWTDEMWFRVSDDRELTGYRFVQLNGRVTRVQRFQQAIKEGAAPPKALEIAAGNAAPLVMRDVQMMMQQMQQQMQVVAQQAQAMGQPPPQMQPPQADQLLLQHPLMQEVVTVNQIDQTLVDLVIDQGPETAVLMDEQFDTLTQMMPVVIQNRPDMAQKMVELIIRASQLPDKREILEMLSKPPDPQQMQQQQQAQQMQMAMVKSQIDVATTKAGLQQAQTAKTAAEAQAIPPATQAEAAERMANAKSKQAGVLMDAERMKREQAAQMPMIPMSYGGM